MNPHRLPDTVVPTRYDLRLEPDLGAATFRGEVVISLDIREPTREVVLNAAELVIDAATFGPMAATIRLDEAAERVHLAFLEALPTGPGRLALTFRGTLNNQLRGFYLSTFRDADGHERRLAATQFEATDARRAFPCWDEPGFKAVFATTLVVPADLTALSNTAVVREEVVGTSKVVAFADTIPLSTYLLAFVVGPLVGSEPVFVGETPVRAWCVPGKLPLTRFGVDVAACSLRHFEAYYDLPYPGGKLDLVALPDFAAGAMENFGCITFRESALLVDEAAATHQERERVADVVAHENAHLWFGDLVTMRWWNGLWLNEAFATFMEMMAVDAYRPAWQRWTTFGVSRAAAFVVDGLRSSRPIEFPVEAPRDAEAMFDVLTYEKGAGVLRMLEQYLGEPVFRAGVQLYLKKHAYGSTETSDLWAGLASASGLPIGDAMHGWIFRAGYPVVVARLEGGDLVLTQRRFLYLDAPDDTLWQIPLRVRVGDEVRPVLLREREQRLAIPVGARVVVNDGGHAFCRVRYQSEALTRLLDALPSLGAIERFNLVNDAWASVLAGLMPVAEYFDLTARFREERDRNVWSVLIASFVALDRLIDDEDRPGLGRLVRDRLLPTAAALGWEIVPGEDELIDPLRGDVLRCLGTLGEAWLGPVEAAQLFAEGRGSPSSQPAIVAFLAHHGDEKRYDDFLARFRDAKTPQLEQRYLVALAGFRRPELVARTLDLCLSEAVRAQDTPLLMGALLRGTHSRAQAWAFFRARWDELARRSPGPGLRRLCEGVMGLVRESWEEEVRAFFASRTDLPGGKVVEQILEQLEIAVTLRKRSRLAMREYLCGLSKG